MITTEKQEVATAIKRVAAELEVQLGKAREVGLTVQLDLPSKYVGGVPDKILVNVFEQVPY
jgi:hypothetical protein